MTPNISFTSLSEKLLPPSKRSLIKFPAFFRGVFSQLIFFSKKNKFHFYNSDSTEWSIVAFYSFKDIIQYNRKLYISLYDNNVGETPGHSESWALVSPNIIGLDIRSRFNGCIKLNLEYAINKFFQKELGDNAFVGFKQPDNAVSPSSSDIRIETVANVNKSFLVFSDGNLGTFVTSENSSNYLFTSTVTTPQSTHSFTIAFPTDVYNAIANTDEKRESIIRGFVDNYCPSGMSYTILIY